MSIYSKSQRGMATILMVALVGFALVSALLGTAYYLRMKQQAAVASHALTNAQQGAWAGVEVVRKYLEKNITQIAKATTPVSLSVNSTGGNQITAKITNITEESTNNYKITAQIINKNTPAKSTSTIEVVYDVIVKNTGGGDGKVINSNSAFDIYTNTTLEGGTVKILTDGTDPATVNIYGRLTVNSTNLTVDTLNVTGDVKFTGGSKNVREIYSNGKVTINSPGTELISLISADSIETTGGGNFGEFYVDNAIEAAYSTLKKAYSKNGDITLSGGSAEFASSGGKIILKNGSIDEATAKGDIDLNGITTVGTLKTLSNINTLGNALNNLNQAYANKNISMSVIDGINSERLISAEQLTCGTGWVVSYLEAKSINGACSSFGKVNTNVSNPVSENDIEIEGKKKEITTPTAPTILATDYEDLANFIFEKETENSVNHIKVTVKNLEKVNNLDINGSYYLMSGGYIQDPSIKEKEYEYVSNSTYKGTGYLCPVANYTKPQNTWSAGSCSGGVQNISRIYPGWSDTRISFSWDGAWAIINNNEEAILTWLNNDTGNSYSSNHDSGCDNKCVAQSDRSNLNYPAMAPSVMLFKGNLKFGQGIYIGTFLATGNIETANSSAVIYSPFYAGAQYVCNVYETAKQQGGGEADTTKGKYRMPTNLCTDTTTLNTSNSFLGNIALLAGSKNDEGTYEGGEIKTAQAPIYGNVIAGSKFSSSGTTYIRGGISVLNLGGANESTMSATVQIDLTNKKDDESNTFQPGTPGTGGGQTSSTASIKWARYL